MPESFTITACLKSANILVYPEREEREEVVRSLVRLLIASNTITKAQAGTARRLLREREELGSTAIGGGVALPHARVKFTRQPLLAFALLRKGEGFNALDGAPVRYVFLVLSPKDEDDMHVAFLKRITLFTSEQIHLNALNGCRTPEEALGVFEDYAAER